VNRDRLMTDLVVSSCVLACLSVSSSATNPCRHADSAHTYANSVEATSGIEFHPGCANSSLLTSNCRVPASIPTDFVSLCPACHRSKLLAVDRR